MEKKIFADLHNHTNASDGDFTPDGLVTHAKQKGIPALSVTDHDTLKGLKEAVAAGGKYGVEVIPGVEVSIRFKRDYFTGTLHLLCYFKPEKLENEVFTGKFNEILSHGRGEKLVKARVEEINTYFGPGRDLKYDHLYALKRDLTFEDIASLSSNATRRHFALALTNSFGIEDKDLITEILGNDSCAYVPSGIELERIRSFIGENKVLAVLAHPAAGSFPGEGHYKEVLPPFETVQRIFPEFLDAGLKGLEVYYPGHTRAYQEKLLSMAGQYHLLTTGGSDCHDGVERPFGVQGIGKADFEKFKKALN